MSTIDFDTLVNDRPWSIFLVCPDWQTCTHEYHVKTARKKFREAISGDLTTFATALHEATCDVWAHRAHGGHYVAWAIANCGPDRHIDWIANRKVTRAIYNAHSTHPVPEGEAVA